MTVVPFVDLIIPVHDASRPIRRAVASALDGVDARDLRVTIVCHGLAAEPVREKLAGLDQSMLRIVEFSDGVRSPAGPFNHGVTLASAPYLSVMGSDDFLEPGAMRSWIDKTRSLGSEAALARLRYQNGDKLDNPLPRARRTERLDAVRDRLFYRTAPLGLLATSRVAELGPLFIEGAPVGGDLNFGARFWTSGARIDYLRDEPCYVIGSDAESRVTTQKRPIREAMAALLDLVARDWVAPLAPQQKRALAIKLIRIHIIGALTSRPRRTDWDGTDLADLSTALRTILALAPAAPRPFAMADRALLDAALDVAATPASIEAAIARRAAAGRFRQLMPRNLMHLIDREGTLARYILYKVGS